MSDQVTKKSAVVPQSEVRVLEMALPSSSSPTNALLCRRGMRFVEIVDAPGKAAFLVAPGAETSDVKVSDCQNLWGVTEVRAYFRSQLNPPVKRAPKGYPNHIAPNARRMIAPALKEKSNPSVSFACFPNLPGNVTMDRQVLSSG
jgi:hypothetical protein